MPRPKRVLKQRLETVWRDREGWPLDYVRGELIEVDETYGAGYWYKGKDGKQHWVSRTNTVDPDPMTQLLWEAQNAKKVQG